MIGAQAVARAAPDGHTLLLGATNNFVIDQFLFPKASFDPLTSFEPHVAVSEWACSGRTATAWRACHKRRPNAAPASEITVLP